MHRNNYMEYKHLYLLFFSVLVLCTQVNMMFVMLLWVYIHTEKAWNIGLTTAGIEPTPLEYYPKALPTEQRGQVGFSMWYFGV